LVVPTCADLGRTEHPRTLALGAFRTPAWKAVHVNDATVSPNAR
jgi:hypothetical protein